MKVRWININERLPKEEKQVWVKCLNGFELMARRIIGTQTIFAGNGVKFNDVTHWHNLSKSNKDQYLKKLNFILHQEIKISNGENYLTDIVLTGNELTTK